MEKRRLGRTGHDSTIVVFGAAGIGRLPQDEADRAIGVALEQHGVNHIDVAPSYGEAELRLGPWLARPEVRNAVFLGCKTTLRDKDAAWDELRRSLDRLRVDRFDLYQLHSVKTMDELEAAMRPGGAIEALQEARAQGLTRYLGITGHGLQVAAVLLEALRRFDFDTVMFPVNAAVYAVPEYRRDAEALLALARQRDVGVHCIKSAARSGWGELPRTHRTWYRPFTEPEEIDRALWFTLSQDGVHCCPSAGDPRILPLVLDAAERYRPLSQQEQEALIAEARRRAEEPVYAPLFAA